MGAVLGPPRQRSREDSVEVELPIHDRRHVRSSTGHVQERYVVLLDVALVDRTVTAEVTLTSRDQMGFRMLIGREALRQGYLVDSRRSLPRRSAEEVRAAPQPRRLRRPPLAESASCTYPPPYVVRLTL
ncbi:putative ATP-dependent zinc protease [Nocardioides sp. B-3]|uniref:putative ATP-dependent zinc protease n=1 Tax=Nocardioides sp. B-3 TaxID=2895565 RepID=UPI002152C552|nr:RimK/LysX family protein [Nocardioides sp. B-3]UUZ61173.1 RimK/LysX family protein [Nocardioides sp. B-3]